MNKESKEQKPYNLALASVFLGVFCIALPAIICGHLALTRIKNNRNKFTDTDKRMAIGGLILGYLHVLTWTYLLLLIGEIVFKWDLSSIFPFGFRL